MSQAETIRSIYRKNTPGLFSFSQTNDHTLKLQLDRFGVERDEICFESENFPYFRAALLDKQLEENDAK
jgi:hypothetical protein